MFARISCAVAIALALCVSASAATPPTVEQIVGVWGMTLSYQITDLNTGIKSGVKKSQLWTITQVDDTQVNIHVEEYGATPSDISARYANGFLLIANGDDVELADNATLFMLQAKGTNPKLIMSGQGGIASLHQSYPEVGFGKLKAKKLGP